MSELCKMRGRIPVIPVVCVLAAIAALAVQALFYAVTGRSERVYIVVLPKPGSRLASKMESIQEVTVSVDGAVRIRNASRTGMRPLQMSPGNHEIIVTAPGCKRKVQTIRLTPGTGEHYVHIYLEGEDPY